MPRNRPDIVEILKNIEQRLDNLEKRMGKIEEIIKGSPNPTPTPESKKRNKKKMRPGLVNDLHHLKYNF